MNFNDTPAVLLQPLLAINWRLYFALIVSALFPVLYTTLRINFLGALPADFGYNIASQLSWVNILYEVLQEGLILPLFFLLGRVSENTEAFANRIRTGLFISVLLYAFLGITIIVFVEPLLEFMGQKPEMIPRSIVYIRIEIISISLSVVYRFIGLVFIVIGREKWLYVLLIIQMIVSIMSDLILVSSFDISFKLGVNGIAIGNIIVNTLLCIVSWIALTRLKIFTKSSGQWDFRWMNEWGRIGIISAIESFVRNLVFILMIVRLINQVQEQGNFWIANNFIWGWLLLPVLTLGELIKRDAGTAPLSCKKRLNSYLIITGGICIIWLSTIPFWETFINKVMGVEDFRTIYRIILLSLPFYIIYAFNNVIDSVFYGLGRTDLILIQSLTVNILFYGGAFIASLTGVLVPTLTNIVAMFGLGIFIDSILTWLLFLILQKKNKLFR